MVVGNANWFDWNNKQQLKFPEYGGRCGYVQCGS